MVLVHLRHFLKADVKGELAEGSSGYLMFKMSSLVLNGLFRNPYREIGMCSFLLKPLEECFLSLNLLLLCLLFAYNRQNGRQL